MSTKPRSLKRIVRPVSVGSIVIYDFEKVLIRRVWELSLMNPPTHRFRWKVKVLAVAEADGWALVQRISKDTERKLPDPIAVKLARLHWPNTKFSDAAKDGGKPQ